MFGIDVLGIDEQGKTNDILLFMQPLSAQKRGIVQAKVMGIHFAAGPGRQGRQANEFASYGPE